MCIFIIISQKNQIVFFVQVSGFYTYICSKGYNYENKLSLIAICGISFYVLRSRGNIIFQN